LNSEDYSTFLLKELCDFNKKNILPKQGEIYVHYSLPAFDNEKTPEIQDGEEIKSSKFLIEPNTILYNKLNVRFKRIWNINFQPEKNSICSTEFIPIKPKNIDQSFLYYYLSSKEFTIFMGKMRTGTSNSHQRISPDALKNHEILLPPKTIQEKIGKILSLFDEKIEINKKINQNLVLPINC